MVKVVDLFCGEGATSGHTGWGSAFLDRGHEVFSVDIDPVYQPSLVADILELHAWDFPWQPDLILASPPCQGFSVAQIGRNWKHGRPTTPKAQLGLDLVAATRRIIREAEVEMFIIENPRGMLRKQDVVADLERRFITYCQYGRFEMKPTDLWGGFPPLLELRAPCGRDGACHDRAPSGSWYGGGVQGIHNRLKVTAIPYHLSWDVCIAAERSLGEYPRRMVIHC